MSDFDKLIHHKPYIVTLGGEEIIVHDGVFAPDPEITNSTLIILNHLPNVQGKTVLDIGTGTGIISIVCSKRGAKNIVAGDVDAKAVLNAEENITKTKLSNIVLVQSDLYENIPNKFDYIFANLPILPEIWGVTGGTPPIVEKFLKDSASHLNPGGNIYVPWFSASDVNIIRNIGKNLGYKEISFISENKFGFTWYLLVFSLK